MDTHSCVGLTDWDPDEDDDWDPDLVDDSDDPPKCKDCDGKGKYLLFHFYHVCKTCGGSGY